jgi:Uncharacterised nucleotidyltransferase
MTDVLSPEILRLLRDREARPEIPSGAHADALLRRHVLGQIGAAMHETNVPALLVKGAALALTVYPDAAARRMSDIDVLVAEADQARAVKALENLGWLVGTNETRRFSGAMLGETMVQARIGAMTFTVEVHTSLDKVVRRPITFADLMKRASAAPGCLGLSVPSREDHTLLVALHASTHEFRHTLALQDMELLLRSGLDKRELLLRCDAFRLRTVMFVMLSVLRHLGAASVDEALVRSFDPGWVRRGVLERFYDVRVYPPARGDESLGLAWIARQAPLWDDARMFAAGVLRYAAVRGLERGIEGLRRAQARAKPDG